MIKDGMLAEDSKVEIQICVFFIIKKFKIHRFFLIFSLQDLSNCKERNNAKLGLVIMCLFVLFCLVCLFVFLYTVYCLC